MYKVLHFIKRKPHMTHEAFKQHFERSHAPLALKVCGHLFAEYRRNYVNAGDAAPRGWDWDVISEWILPSEEALHEIYRIMQEPGTAELFLADEDRFIDRAATVTVTCEVHDRGTAFDPRGTVFDTPGGEPRWD